MKKTLSQMIAEKEAERPKTSHRPFSPVQQKAATHHPIPQPPKRLNPREIMEKRRKETLEQLEKRRAGKV